MVAFQGSLPPPSAAGPSIEEISFRRLLKKCGDVADGDWKGKPELRSWRTSVLFHHYVETLAEQVADLQKTGRVEDEVLKHYQDAVSNLSKQLQPVATTAPAAQPDAAAGQQAARAALFARLQDGEAAVPQAVPSTGDLSEGARRNLRTQEQLQEMLTDEMVGMAASMKDNSLTMENHLRQRAALLDDTDAALQHSLHHALKSKAKAKEIHGRSRIGFCKMCMTLLFVGCAFVGMYMFIRVTYFVGFKQ